MSMNIPETIWCRLQKPWTIQWGFTQYKLKMADFDTRQHQHIVGILSFQLTGELVYVCVYVIMYACVWQRERERERVYVCVWCMAKAAEKGIYLPSYSACGQSVVLCWNWKWSHAVVSSQSHRWCPVCSCTDPCQNYSWAAPKLLQHKNDSMWLMHVNICSNRTTHTCACR